MEPPPEVLTDKEEPFLDEVEMLYWKHFQELQTERPLGAMGGAGAIPWSSIDRYAERHGFLEEGYLQFMEIMRHLDELWLNMMHEKQEKEKAKSKSSKSPARRK